MSSYELAIYIRNELESNISHDQIVAHLLAAGMKKEDIEQAFSEVGKADLPSSNGSTFWMFKESAVEDISRE